MRKRGSYTSLPAFLLPESFTLSELRRAYEAVLGRGLNDSAFRRKVEELRLLEAVEGRLSKASFRPAQLYQLRHPGVIEFDRTF
ncbi:MAG: hypothetical protein U1E15_06030 [Hyphomicrobiales bacterium]